MHILGKIAEAGMSWLFEQAEHEGHQHGKRRRQAKPWVPIIVGVAVIIASWHGARTGVHDLEPRIAKLETKFGVLVDILRANRTLQGPMPADQQQAAPPEEPWISAAWAEASR